MFSKTEDGQVEALPASEYPIPIDAFLPAFGTNENDSESSSDIRAAPSTIRYNSIHRYTLSTRTITHYCRLEQIGEGTYGQVYRAKCLTPTQSSPRGGETVALKKIRLHHPGYWGIPPTVIREIKILKKLQHKNMVKMYEVVSSKGAEELDWEDAREDEKRKKEVKSNKNNNSTPLTLGNPENAESLMNGERVDKSCKKNGERKNVSLQMTSRMDSIKKKKKDSMSDLEKLRESYKGNLFLVLEYISHDLTGLLDMAIKFTEVQIKSIIKQLLEVLEFMHLRNYVHRDLKTSNVLITDQYEVKLADFGLARSLESSLIGRAGSNESFNSNEGEYTNKVITLWYRPPELLLGETKYGTAVDIWSAGCIFAEIILGRPIFTGKTELDQLKLIFDLVGTPNERSWEGFAELKLIRTGEISIEKERRPKLREKYGSRIQPATALSLLEKLLELDPKKRFTARRALHHRYFQSEPVAPENPKDLGTINLGGDGSGYHEFQTKKRRREAKAVAKIAEEEAKIRGEIVEKQKEAFDRAYRDHLQKGASAVRKKGKNLSQLQGQQLESYPWEEFEQKQHPSEDDPNQHVSHRYLHHGDQYHPNFHGNGYRPSVQSRPDIVSQRSCQNNMITHMPLKVGVGEVVTAFHQKYSEKDDQACNSSSLQCGNVGHLPSLSGDDNNFDRIPISTMNFGPQNDIHGGPALKKHHPEQDDRRRASRDINDCLEDETHRGDGKGWRSDLELCEATRRRVRVRVSVKEHERYGHFQNQHDPDDHNHTSDYQGRSDYYTNRKKKEPTGPAFSEGSRLMSPVSLHEVDPKIKHGQLQQLISASCNRNNEGQLRDKRYGSGMLNQPREFDNGLSCKRRRNHLQFNGSGEIKDRIDMDVSTNDKCEQPRLGVGHLKEPRDHSGSRIGSRGNQVEPSLVPSLGRQYDRYGNPVCKSAT